MIEQIIVCSKSKVNEISHELKVPHAVISIQGTSNDHADRRPYLHPSEFRKAVLFLNFDDVDIASFDDKLMSEIDAQRILNFVEKYKDKVTVFIVQCYAGISRSAAVAASINYINHVNEYMDYFRDSRYHPNRYVYSTILRVYYNQFQQNNSNENKI